MDDANGVAELFDFAHDVGGEDDGLAVVAAFANESGDGACGHDVEAKSGFIEDHDRRVVNKSACDGGLLLHACGELVAAAVAEAVHVETMENIVDALFEGRFVQAIEAAEVFDQFLSGEAGIEGRGGGEKTDAGTDFFGSLDDIVAADERGAVSGLKDGGEHAEGGGFAGAIGSEEAVNPARLAGETDVIDSADFTALFVPEALGQATSINHQETPWRVS